MGVSEEVDGVPVEIPKVEAERIAVSVEVQE